jgi:pyruvate/2-oxoglutarate dehydrogenase complex dihydrolipoamide dehydrogenase (E3) component
MPDAKKIFWHIVYQKHSQRILGATLWGGIGAAMRINTLNLAIRLKLSASELAAGDFLYSPKFSPMLDGFHVLARILDKS